MRSGWGILFLSAFMPGVGNSNANRGGGGGAGMVTGQIEPCISHFGSL